MTSNTLKLIILLGGALVAYLLFELGYRFFRKEEKGSGGNNGHGGEDEWDMVYREYMPGEIPWEARKPDEGLVAVVEGGKVKKGRALDLGSGLGTQALYLAKKGFKVSGIDLSPTAVEIANKRAELEGLDCSFLQGNALDLPYPDGSFDFVFDRGCFHHIPEEDREGYVRSVRRVLKKGGRYFMECFSYRNGSAWNHFTPGQIEEYFRPYFKILSIEDGSFKEPRTGHVLHVLRNLMEK
jgi:SAM-dependent methyltransferase